ncbi:MAG: YfhO family protein [Anaerolineae bacterium]
MPAGDQPSVQPDRAQPSPGLRWRGRDWLVLLFLAALVLLFHWRLITPDPADRGSYPPGDFSYQFWAFSTFEARELGAGRLPLWNPYAYSGSPFWADVQAAVFYPPSLLTLALSGLAGGFSLFALELEAIAHFWLAAAFAYLFLRRVTQHRLAGVVGALVFTFSGYLTGYPSQQLAILEADVWLPLVLFFIDRAWLRRAPGRPARFRTRARRADLWLGGLAWGLAVLAGHPQSAMLVGYTFTAYTVFLWLFGGAKSNRPGARAALGRWLLVVALGFALAAIQLLPALEYLRLSVRSGGSYERMAGGFPLVDVVQVLLPGQVSLYSPLYLGLAGLLLALAATFGLQSRFTTFWAAWGGLALLISFGGNTFFYSPLYLAGPGFSLFRGQERWAFLVAFSLSVLAGYGAGSVLAAPGPATGRGRKTCLHFLSKLTGWLWLFALGLVLAFFYGLNDTGWSPASQFYGLLNAAVLLTILLAGAWVLWRIGLRAGKDSRGLLFAGGLVALILFDLFTVNWQTNLHPALPEWHTQKPAVVRAIEEDPFVDEGPFRVYNEFRLPGYENYGVPFALQDLWGASPLRLSRYERFLVPPMPIERAWELLNVRYVITWRSELYLPSTIIYREPAGEDETTYVHRLEADVAGPRAWVVHRVETLGEDEILARIADPAFDRWRVALLEQPPDFPLGPGQGSTAVLTAFSPNRLAVEVDAAAAGLLLLSEIAYPGWRATVNSAPAPVLRADYILRAVPVPAGRSTVELAFRPWTFYLGATVSGLALLLAGLGLGLEARSSRSRSRLQRDYAHQQQQGGQHFLDKEQISRSFGGANQGKGKE